MAAIVGLAFWVGVNLFASALPIRMPRGALFSVSVSTIMAATMLGGPAAGAWVGLLGSTEIREIRGRVPWYGTLANHAGIVIPAAAAGLAMWPLGLPQNFGDQEALPLTLIASLIGGTVYLAVNAGLTAVVVSLRTGQGALSVIAGEARGTAASILSLAPIGWLMAQIYIIAAWASLLFALPLYMTRLAYQNYTEMREMFTQTIGALAAAVDKRDPYTAKHSERVKDIAGDIGRVLRLGEADLEALEWGGLLHDVGKIGVPDAVLLKQDLPEQGRADDDELAPGPGRADHQAGDAPLARAADHPPPPRVVQRVGLPGPPDRRRDPAAGPGPARGGLVRGDDRRPALPDDAADRGAGDRGAAQVRRHPVRSQDRGRLRPDALGRGRGGSRPHDPAAAHPDDRPARQPAARASARTGDRRPRGVRGSRSVAQAGAIPPTGPATAPAEPR